jgi:tetratricopeptide (TPR) repeat protein
MNRKTNLILAGSFLTATCLVVLFGYRRQATLESDYVLLERSGTGLDSIEWLAQKQKENQYKNTLNLNQDDLKALTGMAGLFIQEARITGNYSYYDNAASYYVQRTLAIDSNYFDALTLQSLLYFNQHHFSEGLTVAKKLVKMNPYNAFVFGLLTDGFIEMGQYDSALVTAQRMMDIRPDIRSYSRVSYLREIHGDYKGAIEAMKAAIESGVPGDETTCWSLIQLARLFENTGDTAMAIIQYENALYQRPGYTKALEGLANLYSLQNKHDSAVNYYLRAMKVSKDPSIKEGLAEVYFRQHKDEQGKTLLNEIIYELSGNNSTETEIQSGHGHHADKELANLYIKINDPKKALSHAVAEYNRRPQNADANEALAWAYYYNNELENAKKHIAKAMERGNKNPELLAKAALINTDGKESVLTHQYLAGLQSTYYLLPYYIQNELKSKSIRTSK